MDEQSSTPVDPRAVVANVLAPLIERDGGTIELVRVEGAAAIVRLGGACNGCPGRAMTIEHVILPALRRANTAIERVDVAV
ncbi:MAG: NifU family protein [Myxococcales bacterium]|nr:NifU family protein [Myxococcales bacterium]